MKKIGTFMKPLMASLAFVLMMGGPSDAFALRSSTSVDTGNAFVAVTTWRSGRYETTYNQPSYRTCSAPSGTVLAYRTFVRSGYHGRGGSDNYFWMCFYRAR